jgi:hypothetical protein
LTVPLTFGQLSVLRGLQQLPPERWAETYTAAVVELPADATVATVTAALTVLGERHESLRTHFSNVVESPSSRTMPAPRVEPMLVDVPGVDESAARREADRVARQRFDWDSQFAWRQVLVHDGDRLRYAVLVVDHIAADGWGMRRLAAELRALLGDDEQGRFFLGQSPPRPRELARLQRSDEWLPRRAGAAAYWHRLLRQSSSGSFPWPAGGTGRIQSTLYSGRARWDLHRAARRLKISPQAVALALTAVMAGAVFGLDDVVLTLQASNRFDRRWQHIVSSMNQAAPLPVRLDVDQSVDHFVRSMHVASINAYRHGSYDVDEVRSLVLADRGVPLRLDAYFNFMAGDTPADGAEPETHAPARVERSRPYRQLGPRFDVKVQAGPEMPVTVRADPSLLEEQRLDALLSWFDEEAGRLAAGDDGPLRRVRQRCAAALL